jgi:cytochrome b
MMTDKRLVWDLPLRLFHWALVLSIVASWLTAEAGFEWMQIHFYLGFWTLGLVSFRILWGFIGPRHARFANFIPSPKRLVAYTRSVFKRDSTPSIGHNPLGGLMVVVMILMVAAQAASGLFVTDDIAWAGPYNPSVSAELAGKLTWFHHLNFNVLAGAIGLHVLAILFYALYKRQNLVSPMISGRKPATLVEWSECIPGSQLIKALLLAAVCAGAVYWLIAAAPPPPEIYY